MNRSILFSKSFESDDDDGTTEINYSTTTYSFTSGLFILVGMSIIIGFITIQYRRRRQGGGELGRGKHERVSQCEMTEVGSKNNGGSLRFDNGNIA